MLKPRFCNYSDRYILVKGIITFSNKGTAAVPSSRSKNVMFRNCALFTDCISEINNKEIYYAKDTDVAIPMYNLIEYSDNYLKTSGRLW